MDSSWLGVAIGSWLLTVGAGLGAVAGINARPGTAAEAPAHWPGESALVRLDDRPTLVHLVHPRCPCSRASLEELNLLLHESEISMTAHIVFVIPDGTEPGFEQAHLWRRALAIPGATVIRDTGGREAERFGAWTSGQTLVYSASGDLVFSGGITPARGHAGDNIGRRRAAAALEAASTSALGSAVFGCPLVDSW